MFAGKYSRSITNFLETDMAKINKSEQTVLTVEIFSESDMAQAREFNVCQVKSKAKRKNKYVVIDLQFLVAGPLWLRV
jgi:hypothetical protein